MKKSIGYVILSACASFSAHAAQDLIGIRLGMTEEEVVAVLKVHNPSLIIEKNSSFFQYSDGTKSFQTPKFLTKISAHNRNTPSVKEVGEEELYIDFAGGPSTSRVAFISRNMSGLPKLVSHELFYKSMVDKYGKVILKDSGDIPSTMMWVFGGKSSCSYGTSYDIRFYDKFSIIREDFNAAVEFIQGLKRIKKITNDLSECGVFLQANISAQKTGLASSYNFYLFDPDSYMKNRYAQQAWVRKLTEDATNKVRGTGVAPKI